jgi:rfaE bifunctional protein nucleotidyltransferase chain/domain
MVVQRGFGDLQELARGYRAAGLVVGLCHGCFDIVHLGHIYHLRQARVQVDRLFVSVTDDAFVNKGPDRPIFPAHVRTEFIASIRYCDHALISHAPTAERVISLLRPDVFFKGPDYRSSTDPRVDVERTVVERNGGRLVLTRDEIMDSTSRIARIILAASS